MKGNLSSITLGSITLFCLLLSNYVAAAQLHVATFNVSMDATNYTPRKPL